MRRLPPIGVFGFVAVLSLGGCHAVFGLDDLAVEDSSSGGNGGQATAAGGSGSAQGGAGGQMAECQLGSDCPGVETGCRKRACPNGMCGFENTMSGSICIDDGGTYCDGNGSCVECLVDGHCTLPETCSLATGQCVGPACKNGMLDAPETDIDCGGGTCVACANDKICASGVDCLSGVCSVGNTCVACSAGACGGGDYCDAGVCEPKLTKGAVCTEAGSCLSGFCTDGVCCDTACDTTCRKCQVSGSCGFDAAYTDPMNECPGVRECDGGGQCKLPDGFSCSNHSDCIAMLCLMNSCDGDPI